MIKLKVMVNTCIRKELGIKVSEKMINSMVKVKNYGLMEQNMKGTIFMVKKMAMVILFGLITQTILVNLKIIESMEKVFTPGQMVDHIKDVGKIIKCVV